MSKYELLNNVEHKDVKVKQGYSAQFGDNMMCCATCQIEFRSVQNNYPIFFSKDINSGKFVPVAMFGFIRDENLFLADGTWQSNYIPLRVRKGPFFIGYKNQQNTTKQDMVISIDTDDPRINSSEGEPAFDDNGDNSQYLENVSNTLKQLHEGEAYNEAFTQLLTQYDLLEPFSVDIELKDGSQNSLVGFYTINEDNLAALTSEALNELHKKGALAAIYMVIASLSNIHNLIDKKNNTLYLL